MAVPVRIYITIFILARQERGRARQGRTVRQHQRPCHLAGIAGGRTLHLERQITRTDASKALGFFGNDACRRERDRVVALPALG